MNQRVEECAEPGLASRNEHDAKPPDIEHGAVVEDVEESDLIVLLSQHHQYGIRKLDQLREEIPPQYLQ